MCHEEIHIDKVNLFKGNEKEVDRMGKFGARLKELRKQKKMTLKEVGDHLGMTPTAISCYEHESRKPSPQILQKLAELYDTSSDDILGVQNEGVTNIKTILSSNKLHWDGIPLQEDELVLIKQFLELRVKDREKGNEDSSKNVG